MAILAVGGEAECFEVDSANSLATINWGYEGFSDRATEPVDRRFSRGSLDFSKTSYLNFVDPNGTATLWLRMMWNHGSGNPTSRSGVPLGFTVMRDGVKMFRLAFNTSLRKYFIQSSSNGGASWTDRGNGFAVVYDRTQHFYDFHFIVGSAIEVYRDGVKIDSFYGSAPVGAAKANRIMFDMLDGYFSEIIAADESTIGMRLFTYPLAFGGLVNDFDNSGTLTPGSGFTLVQEVGLSWAGYLSTANSNVSHLFSTDYSPKVWTGANPGTFDFFSASNNFDYIAIAVAGAFQNIPNSAIADAVFVLTDNDTQYYESPLVGAVQDGKARRAQWILDAKPLSGSLFNATDVRTLQPGVRTT